MKTSTYGLRISAAAVVFMDFLCRGPGEVQGPAVSRVIGSLARWLLKKLLHAFFARAV